MATSGGGSSGGGGGGIRGGSTGSVYSSGAGSLSSGSSGAAYSGGNPLAFSKSWSSMSEEERKRLLEQQRQQAAAQQQKAAGVLGVVEGPGMTAQGITPPGVVSPAVPGAISSPSPLRASLFPKPSLLPSSPPATMTPYGPISTTNPQGQANLEKAVRAPNILTQPKTLEPAQMTPQGRVADAYRNLPANVSPQERKLVMEAYRGALGTPAEREHAQVMGQREDRMVELMTRGEKPEDRAGAMEKARAELRGLTPEQKKIKYFGDRGETWQQTAQKAPSISQERARESQFETAAQIDRDLSAAIRDARAGGVDEKGRRTKPDRALLAELREKQLKFRTQENLVDPRNPKAGLGKDYAMKSARDRFLGDSGSLLETARQQRVAQEKAPDQTQRQLEAVAREERQRIELEKELQRRRLIGRNLMAAYS